MQIRGYMIDVEFDGETLTAQGTNKAAHLALRGQERGEGPVEIPTDSIESVKFKKAGALANGMVDVRTKDGKRYQLHFRKKSNDEFGTLFDALESATN